HLLFATSERAARTDFSDARESAETAADVLRLCGFLAEHAEHEDRVLAPELERLAPTLAADLRADHARTQGLERELVALAERLRASSGAERRSLGARVEQRLGRLTAEHLVHLEREE